MQFYAPNAGTGTKGFYRIFFICLMLNIALVGAVSFSAVAGALWAYRWVL